MSALAVSRSARLPVAYTDAVKALQRCQSIDEAKVWRDKAEAVAGWARISKDETLLAEAMRVTATATRRMGELLSEIPEARGANQNIEAGGRPKVETRKETAERAGLSSGQAKQALRVAAIPEKKFEKLVDAEKPPTLTELARIGTKPRAQSVDHLRGRDPKDFNVAIHAHGAVSRFVKDTADYDIAAVSRGTDPDDRAEKAMTAREAIRWLERLLAKLEKKS